eukprot:3015890-Prymnesium_polylepis.1
MGQWTDDTSMALCLADSLLANGGFHPRDLRLRFALWWMLGLNNAFGYDKQRPERRSIGAGGLVGQSICEFLSAPSDYTACGTDRSSGNGSIMRLAPVPILHWQDEEAAMEVAWR